MMWLASDLRSRMARVCLAQQLECADGSRAANQSDYPGSTSVVVTSPPDGYCRKLDDRLARRSAERAEYESRIRPSVAPLGSKVGVAGEAPLRHDCS